MSEYDAEEEYRIREKKYSDQFKKETQQYDLLSNLRLAAFLGIVCGAVLYYLKYQIPGSLIFTGSLLLFVFFIVRHEKVKQSKERAFLLANINQKALNRISGKWIEFSDTGEEYIDSKHPYSIDLDIFGVASLFQWINNTFTYMGREFLKGSLAKPLKEIEKIKERQSAISELSGKLDWRQEFLAEGNSIVNGMNDPDILLKWAESETRIFRYFWVRLGIKLLTAMTVVSIFLPFISNKILFCITGFLLLVQFGLFIAGFKYHLNVFEVTKRYKNAIGTFKNLLIKIEKENFESKHLNDLVKSLTDQQGNSASKKINELFTIVDMMSIKNNPVLSFILNVFFLWDYHLVISLEKWKEKSGCNLRTWLMVIGKFEELISLSNISYDNPKWCMPEFTDSKQYFSSKDMGHPLLPSDLRVSNDLDIKGFGNILLITGSNMSGKSTLLRTVGLDLILAYTGTPVCASYFKCSVMDIYTSMRVNDNLEKKISSFYAELLRIKTIVEAAAKDNSILFLLDEIFRGTNTKDRNIGAAAVLKKLSKMGAIGIVSTHDLELGELENNKDVFVKNYHFTEKYVDNQITFDYKLRNGISKTTNAIYLMRMVGIDEL